MFSLSFQKLKKNMDCPHYNNKNTKKNGHTHHGKQNHLCKDCEHKFVAGGQDWFVY